MAAYAALISLKNTIERILNPSRISLVPPSSQLIMDHANEGVQPLLETLRSSSSISSKRANALDAEIRDAVCKFEDLLQSHLSPQISSQSGRRRPISADLQDLRQDVESFVEYVKKMQEAYAKELSSPLQEDEDEDEGVSSRHVSKMVGFSDVLNQIRSEFTKSWPLHAMALSGMAGIGKTTVARQVCEDPLIKRCFEHIVWVKIGRSYQLNKIARDILAQVNPQMAVDGGGDVIAEHLRQSMESKRCLIVLDDAWDTRVWKFLFYTIFGAIKGNYAILLTTRERDVAESMDFFIYMVLLNKEESWDLLRERVFGEDHCPYLLEREGKKIAQNCDGLPLTIVTVARLLSMAERSVEYWRMVAERKSPAIKSFFLEVERKLSKVHQPSYDRLPQHLRLHFLYMGVFPENFEIHPTKLINLWAAEGFLEPNETQTLEKCAIECLEKLASKNLIIFVEKSCNPYMGFGERLKTCRLQSSLWQFCNGEALSNKFFHALDNHGLVGVQGQRLCIQNNILCTIKDEYKSSQNSPRSLLFYNPHHRYQVPIRYGLRLLKVLDALTIRFYEFPVEVVELVWLKYLSLTCNGELPPSISNLRMLELLIVRRYSSIVQPFGAAAHVPVEIWDMQELKHVQIMGSTIPDSDDVGACLSKLSTLVGVSAHTCTKEVLERIPNLEKLGIRIELAPDDDRSRSDDDPFCLLNQIFRLRTLRSLKCVVVNPELRPEVVAAPPLSMFPSSLTKLHLSGMGYPWEYMNVIAAIPHLHVLKLRNNAFRGPKWEIQEDTFYLLRFLIIEDTDLEQWKVGRGSLVHLVHVSMKHCYNLEQIDWESDIVTDKVEIVDCNPLAVECLNQIKSRKHYRFKDLDLHSSWHDGKKNV